MHTLNVRAGPFTHSSGFVMTASKLERGFQRANDERLLLDVYLKVFPKGSCFQYETCDLLYYAVVWCGIVLHGINCGWYVDGTHYSLLKRG